MSPPGAVAGTARRVDPAMLRVWGLIGVLAVAAIALKVKHPVRWIEDRWEHMVGSAQARDHAYTMTVHAAADGEFYGRAANRGVARRRSPRDCSPHRQAAPRRVGRPRWKDVFRRQRRRASFGHRGRRSLRGEGDDRA